MFGKRTAATVAVPCVEATICQNLTSQTDPRITLTVAELAGWLKHHPDIAVSRNYPNVQGSDDILPKIYPYQSGTYGVGEKYEAQLITLRDVFRAYNAYISYAGKIPALYGLQDSELSALMEAAAEHPEIMKDDSPSDVGSAYNLRFAVKKTLAA